MPESITVWLFYKDLDISKVIQEKIILSYIFSGDNGNKHKLQNSGIDLSIDKKKFI